MQHLHENMAINRKHSNKQKKWIFQENGDTWLDGFFVVFITDTDALTFQKYKMQGIDFLVLIKELSEKIRHSTKATV